MEVRGRRTLVMGLGRHGGGVVAARWLARQGAVVTITDQADAAALADSVAALADVDIAGWALGGHSAADFDAADIVVVNPAVRPSHPLIARAASRGAQITSELELFLERCPGRIVGITGSNGKSTTAAMIAAILRADGRRTFLGGNIGHSLLADLDTMTDDSWAVVEISSFQLAWLSDRCRLPEVSVLTNFTPNHLDWHGTLAAYAAAKARLFARQRADDVAVVGTVPILQSKMGLSPSFIGWESASRDVNISSRRARQILAVPAASLPALRVPGMHNRANAACAAAAAEAIGCAPAAISAGLQGFSGLTHRLELVASIEGRAFYNDSMATTPESAVAALETFSGRCWLLAGGYDKGCDMAPLADAIARHARGAAFFGAAGPRLHAIASACAADFPSAADFLSELVETLDAALAWCWRHSRPGDCITLSPACASYDQFVDYRARGERFRTLVSALEGAA